MADWKLKWYRGIVNIRHEGGQSFCQADVVGFSGLWQGEFYHWVALFNHFDDFLEKTVQHRSDLELRFEDHEHADPPFPTEVVVVVLRTITIILENCANKHFWASYEVLAFFHVHTRERRIWLHCKYLEAAFH